MCIQKEKKKKKKKKSYQKRSILSSIQNGNYYRVYKLKDPLNPLWLRKQDNFQIRVDCTFYWKTKIYNLEWIIWGMTRGVKH